MNSKLSKEDWAMTIASTYLIEIIDKAKTRALEYSHVLNYVENILNPIFFDYLKTTRINDKDPDLRIYRLRLMKSINKQLLRIADFSRLR